MLKIRTIFSNLNKIAYVVICFSAFAQSARAEHDPSLNTAGEPRWDRFIVTNNNVDFGAPGDIETPKEKSNLNSAYMYQSYDENPGSGFLYGKYDPNSAQGKKQRPARASANPHSTIVASGFFKDQKKPQDAIKKVKPAAAKVANGNAKADIAPIPKVVQPIPEKMKSLDKIVSVAGKKSVEDFCDYSRIPDKTGAGLPPGFVLMAGAPDRMNCKK
ncbi:MAG: hypothetical protein LBK26_02275 [Rickettsiales bacterium]|jgi:hypothetical protein|nr:hypothetical protein [Rickettsiales bacterium]